jgi:hypothetical protein
MTVETRCDRCGVHWPDPPDRAGDPWLCDGCRLYRRMRTEFLADAWSAFGLYGENLKAFGLIDGEGRLMPDPHPLEGDAAG